MTGVGAVNVAVVAVHGHSMATATVQSMRRVRVTCTSATSEMMIMILLLVGWYPWTCASMPVVDVHSSRRGGRRVGNLQSWSTSAMLGIRSSTSSRR